MQGFCFKKEGVEVVASNLANLLAVYMGVTGCYAYETEDGC